MHVVAPPQLFQCLRSVLQNQIDDFLKLGKIPVSPFDVLFQISAERFGEVGG